LIRALVDFALKSRWLVLGGVAVLAAWGVISFRALPIEAYPDVANNYVQIITQWPGRSAEEIERQVTVPVEIQMAGIPHLTHLRSTTLAGLSSLMLIFDDDSMAPAATSAGARGAGRYVSFRRFRQLAPS
jgi:cobalt-zinc-cadmium resistance protein CzcA